MLKQVKIPSIPNPRSEDVDDYSIPRVGKPFLFQILSPGTLDILYPVLLALHVNPDTVEERMTKNNTIAQSYGGIIEFVWNDDFDVVSASGSTGGFLSPEHGLESGGSILSDSSSQSISGRRGTIAWERQQDFLELFRNNGCVYDSTGTPVLRGRVMMIYDRGAFIGHFTTFSVSETSEKQFTFQLTWEFKIENAVYKVPTVINQGGV